MSQDKKRVLILCFTDLARDPRVYRQILFLKDAYHVTAAGLSDPDIEGVEFISLNYKRASFTKRWSNKLKLKVKRYDKFYWSSPLVQKTFMLLQDQQFDLIVANDLQTLPLSLRLAEKTSAKVLVDAHEYEPLHFDDRWMFNFFFKSYWDYICQTCLHRSTGMTTVCLGIADEYKKNYGVECEVITNAPFYEDLTPNPVEKDRIKIIHHGYVNPSRGMDCMIHLMDHLDDRFHLDFMLVRANSKYFRDFKSLAKHNNRIRFCDPVAMPEIAKTINKYDIGLFPLSPMAFNYRMALPNKIFEFIQARLAVAIWPSPEMARIVNDYDCGVVSEDFTIESLAEKMNNLSEAEIMRFKNNSHQAAGELSAENNKKILLKITQDILKDGHG